MEKVILDVSSQETLPAGVAKLHNFQTIFWIFTDFLIIFFTFIKCVAGTHYLYKSYVGTEKNENLLFDDSGKEKSLKETEREFKNAEFNTQRSALSVFFYVSLVSNIASMIMSIIFMLSLGTKLLVIVKYFMVSINSLAGLTFFNHKMKARINYLNFKIREHYKKKEKMNN